MKKAFILFLLLITSFCTILPSSSDPVDPTILDPFSGLLFGEDSRLSYIFFSKDQHVLIENKNESESGSENKSINSYYKLLNGELYRSNVISYKLEGWGSYNAYYIGIYMRETTLGTELGITVQKSRTLAINAARALETSTSIKEVALGTPLQSAALYTFSALNPIVKTSVAGIFKPLDNRFFSITDLTPTENFHAIYIKSTKLPNGSFESKEYELTFETNISDSTTIYKYHAGQDVFLIGIKFDFNDEFPRLQIIEDKRENNSTLLSDIRNLELKLSTIIAWEYSFFTSLRVLDNSLEPYFTHTLIEFDPDKTLKYDPLHTSLWYFNKDEDSIRVTRRYENVFTEEDYLIGPTPVSGVFELIDFRNDGTQTYSKKFFTITSEGNITDPNTLSTITIADTIDGFDNPIFNTSLQKLEDVTPSPIKVTPNSILVAQLGKDANDELIAGRFGFQAYVESDTDTIHIIGGYTNIGSLPSHIPQTIGNTGDLQAVFNDVWTIKNVLSGTPQYDDTTLDLAQTGKAHFQQMIGATTKKSQTRANDVFWAYGAGAVRDDKFSFNNNTPPKWDTFVLDNKFNLKFHTAMVAHNNSLYILGGASTDSVTSDTGTLKYGEFQNTILVTSTRNNVTASTWQVLRSSNPNATDIWTPRIHSRVFSIGKTMVLVGGMKQDANGFVSNPTNDVWTSEDNGTNWNIVNTGRVPDPTAPEGSVAPPKQATKNDGPLIGTEHNGIIYLLDPATRNVFYSSNKGKDWFKSPLGFETTPSKPLYGAQLVGVKDSLILIGGQTADGMESNMYINKISTID